MGLILGRSIRFTDYKNGTGKSEFRFRAAVSVHTVHGLQKRNLTLCTLVQKRFISYYEGQVSALGGMEKQIPFRIPNAAFRKISIPHSRMGAQLYPFVRSCRNAGGAIIHSECSIPEKIHSALFHSPQRRDFIRGLCSLDEVPEAEGRG